MRLALALLSLHVSTLAQGVQHPLQYTSAAILDSDMDTFIEGVISSWNSSGGAGVAVVKQREDESWQVETKGYGIAKVAEGKSLDADSLFYIASNSKLFATIATGLLISNESLSPRLSWDTKIADILPEHIWKLQDPIASAETTITDAMSHRTGLPRHDAMYSREDDIESIYNDIMYMLLGYLPTVTLAEKPTIATYIKEHIFNPLGLSSATYSLASARWSGHLVDPIVREVNKTEDLFGRGKPRVLRYPTWFQEDREDGSSGAGGIIMSVKDVATWLRVLLLEGKNPQTGDQVIPREIIRKVASGITVMSAEPEYPEVSNVVYGGGQMRSSYRGNDIIEHTGSVPGYQTHITRLPNSKFGIAVFANDGDYGMQFAEVIKWRIVDQVLGPDPVDWNSRIKSRVRESYQKRQSKPRPRPENPIPPPITFEELAGVYQDLGYGDLELCYVSTSRPDKESKSCNKLREDQDVVLPNAVNKDIPTLLARWDRFWFSHFKLEHVDGALFTLTKLDSRPTSNASEPYWTATTDEPFTTEFVVEDRKIGFGMMDGFWGAGAGVDGPAEGSAKERAEVWFEKIQ
ncbi:hypothetical protein VNI00_005478 [Paramarasmius palmivorus]|uniref:Beta-lactamase-related domain-containing protein n=1 Tax=Paramarasmius palmivorus TaxID=297713 RepID=A0AAW0DDS3_9AGAR